MKFNFKSTFYYSLSTFFVILGIIGILLAFIEFWLIILTIIFIPLALILLKVNTKSIIINETHFVRINLLGQKQRFPKKDIIKVVNYTVPGYAKNFKIFLRNGKKFKLSADFGKEKEFNDLISMLSNADVKK